MRIGEFRFSSKQVAMMGRVPDREVAELVGCCSKTVGRARERLKIPPWKEAFAFTPEQIELFGRLPDHEVARRCECRVNQVVKRRNELGITPYPKRMAYRK